MTEQLELALGLRPPRRARGRNLSARQTTARALLAGRPRTIDELAAALGCTIEAAAVTVTSLARRRLVTPARDAAGRLWWRLTP